MNHLFPPNLFSRLAHSKHWLPAHSRVPKQSAEMNLFCISLSNSLCSPTWGWKSYLNNCLLLKFSGLTSVLLSSQNIFCILQSPGQRPLIRPHKRNRFAFSLAFSRVQLWIPTLANACVSRQFCRLISSPYSPNVMAMEILINALKKAHSKPVLYFFNLKIVFNFLFWNKFQLSKTLQK